MHRPTAARGQDGRKLGCGGLTVRDEEDRMPTIDENRREWNERYGWDLGRSALVEAVG